MKSKFAMQETIITPLRETIIDTPMRDRAYELSDT